MGGMADGDEAFVASGPVRQERARALMADCRQCFGLCCVAPAFRKSADFALDKPAGTPCPNLGARFECRIHQTLRSSGFAGCATYDCFGAGQKVAQVTFGDEDWRQNPGSATRMFNVFNMMRRLHELLWHLNAALALESDERFATDLELEFRRVDALTYLPADALAQIDADGERRRVAPLLLRTSERLRAKARPGGRDLRDVDLSGANLRRLDLTGANLGGALLVAADGRQADLRFADLIGADMRGADVRGADLRRALFVTQAQIDSANGDLRTRLPSGVRRPSHWHGNGRPSRRR